MNTDADMMLATRRGKWLSALLALTGLTALLGFQFIALPLLLDLLTNAAGTPPNGARVRNFQWLFVGLGALGLVTAAILIHQARLILRSGQTPPNNLLLWRDTLIVRGEKARRIGRIIMIAAVLTALLCAGLSGYILHTLESIAPYPLRPGVTVLQEKSAPP